MIGGPISRKCAVELVESVLAEGLLNRAGPLREPVDDEVDEQAVGRLVR
ncbi:hypothetical protein ACFW1A_01580 [Kitasatospora sp. NPDC058965]